VEFRDTSIAYLRAFLMVLASALISFAVTIMATLLYTRNSRITKAAGLAFAASFLLGCILNYISLYFWALIPIADYVCQCRIVFVILGETLVLAAMFSKSWEINKIFQRVEKGDISPFHVIPWWRFCRLFFLILISQAVLLGTLMAVAPPRHATQLDDLVDLMGTHECVFDRPNLWLGFETSFFVILMVWGGYLAYQTRHVWTRYKYPNESRSILLSIYNLGFSLIILTPLLTVLTPTEDIIFALVSFAIIYPTTFSLSSVYVPKLVGFLGSSFKKSKGSKRGSSGREAQSVGSTRHGKPDKPTHHDSPGVSHAGKSEESHHKHEKDHSKAEQDNKSEGIPSPSLNVKQLSGQSATPFGWKVLVNPLGNATNDEISGSVFDSPEAAAASSLIPGLESPVRPH